MSVLKGKKKIHVVRFDRISSTNDYAKTLPIDGNDVVIVAAAQDKGRGREGRSFLSCTGGLYLSWVHYPKDVKAKESFWLVARAAVAVCKTLKSYNLSPEIKWPNDVLVGGKKICGVLTENTLSGDMIRRVIVGVGINVNNELDEELLPIATSLLLETGKQIPVGEVEEKLLANLTASFKKEDYFAWLGYLGEAEIIESGTRYQAIAEGVDEDGLLVLSIDGIRYKKSAAEISLRKKEKI